MKSYKLIIGIILVFFSTSCNDWLDTSQLGLVDEKEMFSTEQNIQITLNGFYMDMAHSDLYGEDLTLTVLELMSHTYDYSASDPSGTSENVGKWRLYYFLSNYNYGQTEVLDIYKKIWNKAYSIIFGINNFIKHVKDSDVVSQENKAILLGEAYGLRAFIHFDLFRLFGPVYTLENPLVESIPYNDKDLLDTNLKYLPADEFFNKLLVDIDRSITNLQKDQILTEGLSDEEDTSLAATESFMKLYRNRRFNYHAATALKARVLLYKHDYEGAREAAQTVIDNTQLNEENKIFEFVTSSSVVPNMDYLFYEEIIFGLHNINLARTWDSFMEATEKGYVYSVNENNLRQNIYKSESGELSNSEDIRARQWTGAYGIVGNMYSMKYNFSWASNNNNKKNHQPLIRISEMYYILAEAEIALGNIELAGEAIYKVQSKRGLSIYNSDCANQDSVTEEFLQEVLEREYYKEFFAEGQTYFFLKRRNSTRIMNGYNGNYSDMNPDNYVMPLPTSETDL